MLAIDCGAQGNLTEAFGFEPERASGYTTYEVLTGERNIKECIVAETAVALLPANEDLWDLDYWLFQHREDFKSRPAAG